MTFNCIHCGHDFEATEHDTPAEMEAELRQTCPGFMPEQCGIVCHVCFETTYKPLTVTGRRPSDPEMQDMRWGKAKIVVLDTGFDYASIEMRLLAAMDDPAITSIVLDLMECRVGKLPGIADLPIKESPPPLSTASYLQHDPTKNTRRPRP
jgi:hypothetical protein